METLGESETASDAIPRSKRKEITTLDDASFSAAWALYPKRAGGNPKARAVAAWNARIKSGVQPEDMIDGVKRYALYIRAKGKEGTEYVMQTATFFGPDERWAEAYGLNGNGSLLPPLQPPLVVHD